MMNRVRVSYRPRDGAQLLNVSLATFWRYSRRPEFPRPIRLSPRCTVFDGDELLAWRDSHQSGGN